MNEVIAHARLNVNVYNILMDKRLKIGLSTMINKLLNNLVSAIYLVVNYIRLCVNILNWINDDTVPQYVNGETNSFHLKSLQKLKNQGLESKTRQIHRDDK